ncbi:MAG TPA: class I SAM-dependent methyltransferase [Mycobacteriales bacterium]|nr:class I SAM-dependent methyltransferase [Mycobacteriales bacterium]
MAPAVGSGPGDLTADGCSVEVYAALPAGEEPTFIEQAVPPPASLLELGAGAGRVTRSLLERGYQVTAVDDSAQMLARITGAHQVLARIEALDLGRRYDGVLLCSHLVNSPTAQRDGFLATCARHVAADGCVVIERHEPAWFDTAADSTVALGGVEVSLGDISRPGPGLLSATVTYRIGGRHWTQTFTTVRVDDDELADSLRGHGLVIDRRLDPAGRWIRAVRG